MNDQIARAALMRMNMREVAVASFQTTLATDMQELASADHDKEQAQYMEQRRDELCAAYGFGPASREKPFAFADGIAIIPFSGSLINRFGWSYGYVTGYNFIRRQMQLALADEDVKGIVGDFNTYGGEAAGCFECATEIFEARGTKPMIAVIDSNCYSAGYALASAFDKIVCTPSGGAGSIGVVGMHMNIAKALEKYGVEITFIHYGEHKVDGNPYESLSPAVKKNIQTGVNKSGEAFVALVARNRNLEATAVKATEAACYRADEAMSLGLIDAIATPSQAVQVYFDELSGSVHNPETEDEMSTTAENKPGANEQASNTADLAAARSEARTAERARVSSIMSCEEAKGRTALANHIAMNTDMDLDAAKAMLAASPAAAAPVAAPAPTAQGNQFKEAMDNGKHPNVGADADATAGDKPTDKAAAVLADYRAAGGLMDSKKAA